GPSFGRLLLALVPRLAKAALDTERDLERERVFHPIRDEGAGLVRPVGRHLEEELVVDLEQHAGAVASLAERPVDLDHGDLDDVRRTALDGRVGSRALAELADVV